MVDVQILCFNTTCGINHQDTHISVLNGTYSFPGGKLVLKKQDPEYKRDEPTVIAWLKEHSAPQFVKVKENLDWDNLKKSCAGDADGKMIFGEEITEDGEIVQLTIPGIDVVYREDKFVVEVK